MSDTRSGNGLSPEERALLREVATRANGQAWGVAAAALCGLGLFVATLVLVIKGGPNPGPHLGMLAVYFPGFRVTWLGSVVGLAYGAVTGYVIGRTIAAIYNRLVA